MLKIFLEEKKGFTLIELLVVVAIIALIVTISITTTFHYKKRAEDSRVMADLNQIRVVATLIVSEEEGASSFSKLCDGNGNLNTGEDAKIQINHQNMLKALEEDIKHFNNGNGPDCWATETSYCVQTTRSFTSGYICLDSNGSIIEIDEPYCKNGNFKCSP